MMNKDLIIDNYDPGDPQAALMVRAAEQLDAALSGGPGWSTALGVQLYNILSSIEVYFPDGTSLNVADKFESILGDTGAALIVSALDPEGRDMRWWAYEGRATKFGAPGMAEADSELDRVFANANIRLGGI